MSEIQNNNKIATVGYLSKVLTPIVTLVKNVKTEVMNIFSLPKGGTAGQVLAKTSNVDGEAEWVDIAASGTLDDAPAQGSENAVKSGGVYAALLGKQDELVGVAGQVVGFDADGNAVAQDAAAAVLPVGVEGQYIGYDVDGNPVAMDMPVDHLTREVVDVLPDPTAAEENVIYIYKNADPVTAVIAYEEYQLVDGALVRMSGEPVDLSGYQAKLTGVETQYVGFDADGKAIAVDLPEGHLTREVVDVLPAADVAFEDVVYVLRVQDAADPAVTKYQHWALIDGEMAMIGGADIELPTDHLAYEVVDALPDAGDAVEGKLYILRVVDALGATTYQEYKLLDGALVMSSADLSNVQIKLTGLENQYVGFDVNGDAVAIDLPTDHLVREVVDALPAIDDAKETVVYILKVVDPADASVTYEQWQLIEGAFAQVGGAPVELPENHLTREIVDTLPDPAAALETVLYVLKTEDVAAGTVAYSEWQLIDGAMVQVSSVDLSGYQTKLTGTTGQMIVIDANGDAVAQDFPEGMLTREVVDVLPDAADAKENVTYILKKDDGAGNITYSEWQLINGELVQVGGEVTDMSAYQLKLTGLETQYVGFDALGKAVAIDLPVDHLTREVVDALPAVDAAAETVIYVLKVTDADSGSVTGYQEWKLINGTFVQTSGAAADLSGYQEKLNGLETQFVGFDANGDAVALDMPTGHLTREVVTALPEVGAASEEVVYILKTEDIDAGTTTYEEYILVDGAFVKTSNEATDLSDYQKKIVGIDGQHVVFNAAGELVAADMPEGHLTREVVDALPGVDDAAEDVIYILKVTDPGTAAVSYEEWMFVEGAFAKTSNEAVDLSGKQDLLVGTETQFVGFDADGKAVAKEISEIVDEAKAYTDEQINLAAHLKREIVTADPTTLVDTNEHTIYMYKVDGAAGADVYQEWMLIDGAMTLIGDTSTTIDLSGKQDTLVGTDGQLVGFDAAGAAIAVTPDVVPTEDSALPITSGAVYNALANLDMLPAGTEGQVVGYDVNGDPVAMDLPDSNGYEPVAGAVTTVEPTEPAAVSVTLDDDAKTATWDFSIPRGEDGKTFVPEIGLVEVVDDAAMADVEVVNDDAAMTSTFNFKIPKGDAGADGVGYEPVVGTVNTVASDQPAAVTVALDSGAKTATFNFDIPKGEAGASGADLIDDTTPADDKAYSSNKIDELLADIDPGSKVSYTATQTSGTQIGTITIDGAATKIYVPTVSAGSTVTYTRSVTSGTKIGTITINGTATDIYVPTSTLKIATAAPSSPTTGDIWLV